MHQDLSRRTTVKYKIAARNRTVEDNDCAPKNVSRSLQSNMLLIIVEHCILCCKKEQRERDRVREKERERERERERKRERRRETETGRKGKAESE